ncbi:MAG TPA: hypothetical protein VF247_06835 [Candidatus Krumholzibacteria bacterium]
MKHIAVLAVMLVACGDDSTTPPPPVGPDQTAPHPVDDLTLTYDSLAQAVNFAWTAPRDDELRDRVDRYDIRYSESFPFDWDQATRVAEPPAPLEPGAAQQYQLAGPRRGRDLYASVRAVDAAGNASPAGVVAHARVPGYSFIVTCIDALTDQPVEGLDVSIRGRISQHLATGPDGRIVLNDFPGGTLDLSVTTGSAVPLYHTFTPPGMSINTNLSLVYEMVPFQATDSPSFTSVLHLLYVCGGSPGVKSIKRWYSLPVKWYTRDFVNVNGLDCGALTEQAAERWNTRLGFQLFEPAASDPGVGILVEFLPRSVMGTINGICEYDNDADGYPGHDHIKILDDFADEPRLYSILMHEIGHAIPLGHLGPGFIMYASQPLPSDITDDEVKMVQLMFALPNGTLLDNYDIFPPAQP